MESTTLAVVLVIHRCLCIPLKRRLERALGTGPLNIQKLGKYPELEAQIKKRPQPTRLSSRFLEIIARLTLPASSGTTTPRKDYVLIIGPGYLWHRTDQGKFIRDSDDAKRVHQFQSFYKTDEEGRDFLLFKHISLDCTTMPGLMIESFTPNLVSYIGHTSIFNMLRQTNPMEVPWEP